MRRWKYLGGGIISSAFAAAWWWRPLSDPMIDGNGPKRAGWISRRSISDDADKPLPIMVDAARHMAVFCIVSIARAFLMYGGEFKLLKDDNYEYFLSAVKNRKKGVPLITVSNHRSMVDDPALLSSILPYWMNIQPRYVRYNVCSQEYCFNSKIPSVFLGFVGAGKTLPIWRGGGINQKLLLDFARHCAAGEWCHIFPEAGVWQCDELGGREHDKGADKLGKLKWGVGKLIAHAPTTPVVIPFFHMGLESTIPQDPLTKATKSVIPKTGHKTSLRVGVELHFDDLIMAHEAVHGPLWKYSASATAEEETEPAAFHRHWDSSSQELQLYHKITLRIESALAELNSLTLADKEGSSTKP